MPTKPQSKISPASATVTSAASRGTPGAGSRNGLKSKTPKIPPPKNLWEACVRILEAQPTPGVAHADPLDRIRTTLTLFGVVIAKKKREPWKQWSVYVERHMRNVGVRFMLRDAKGREVDLQKIPGTLEELAQWQPR